MLSFAHLTTHALAVILIATTTITGVTAAPKWLKGYCFQGSPGIPGNDVHEGSDGNGDGCVVKNVSYYCKVYRSCSKDYNTCYIDGNNKSDNVEAVCR